MSFTQEQADAHQRKHGFKLTAAVPAKAEVQPPPVSKLEVKAEKEIHTLIIQELNRRGIMFVHAAMNKRSTLPEGHPDFAIYMPRISIHEFPNDACDGHVWFVEIKTEAGKLSAVQQAYCDALIANGFSVNICRSFDGFLTILRSKL